MPLQRAQLLTPQDGLTAPRAPGGQTAATRAPTTAELVSQLAHSDAQHRRSAAMALQGQMAAAAAMVFALQTETDAQVRSALLASLSTMPCEAVVSGLTPLLQSDEASLRNGAMEVLAQMPHVLAPHVPQLLAHPDADVRLLTLQLLSELAHPEVRAWLCLVLERDDNLNVVASAVEVMAEVGQAQDVPLLEATLARFGGDPFLAFTIDIAISRMEAT
jgi:HEAT repeat protein